MDGILFTDAVKARATLGKDGAFTLELESASTLSLVITGAARFRDGVGLYVALRSFRGVDKSDGMEYGGSIEDLLTNVEYWDMVWFCTHILGEDFPSRFPSRYYWDDTLVGRVFLERR